MSRRLSVQYKSQQKDKKTKPKVTFPDELIFLDSVKDNDVDEVRMLLRRASANIDINKMNNSGKLFDENSISKSIKKTTVLIFYFF